MPVAARCPETAAGSHAAHESGPMGQFVPVEDRQSPSLPIVALGEDFGGPADGSRVLSAAVHAL